MHPLYNVTTKSVLLDDLTLRLKGQSKEHIMYNANVVKLNNENMEVQTAKWGDRGGGTEQREGQGC